MTELGADLEKLDVRAMPLPIANAIAELEAALNPHEERDRLVEVFRATLRLLGGLALAARIEAGPGPKRPGTEVDDRLARLRRQALTDGEWVGLTRELLRPWREVAGTNPLPSLVDVFVGKGAKIHDGLDGLLGMRKRETVAHGTTGTEEEARAIVAERLPQLVDLLHALAPLWTEARIVVPLERPSDDSSTRQRAWLLHGPTPHRGRWRVVDLGEGVRVPPGRPIVIDAAGKPRLSLEPVVLCERASPEVPEDLFFLDGREKKTAVFTAFPSMAEVRRKDVLDALERALAARASDELEAPEAAKSPYLGLQSFGPDDAALFVGREKLVEDLTNRILANPWVTVTGASGSGKTSLLAAGVGPALRSRIEREREAAGYRGDADATDYALVMLRPGSDPMGALAANLDSELGVELDRAAPAGWARRILDWAAARRRVLVVIVDQAEELVTLCRDVERREAFGALLSDLTSESETPVRVVLSLRVDFMAQLATIRSIGDRYQRATQVVTTPARDDLVRILVEPAARFGVTWEPGLAEEIADRVNDRVAALPLVSFVASELWKRRGDDDALSRAAYDAVGGVEGALAGHADEVVATLTEAQRKVVRTVLLRLVTADGTRDVVPRAEIDEASGAQGAGLVDTLVAQRLLSSRELPGGDVVVELAHEALLEHWPRVKMWRAEDQEAEVHHARLRAAVRDWVGRGRPRHALWRGEALAEHRAVVKRRALELSLTSEEREFLSASSRAATRARAIAIGVTTTVSVVVGAFAIFATVQWQTAEHARERADAGGLLAEAMAERNEVISTVMMAPRHWASAVLPRVRIRQWVLSLPFELRVPLAYHHDLTLAVHGVTARVIEGWYRDKGRELGIADGRTGSITAVQRFGSDLALNLHFHMLLLDGVYDVLGHFTPIAAPARDELEVLCTTIAERVQKLLERRALEHDEPDERALCFALCRSAARRGTDKHAPEGTDSDHDGEPGWKRKARVDGFDLEATTEVRGEDRERLENLCRYLLRPPLADRRLCLLPADQVALELKSPWKDGTTWVSMSADTFLERLSSLVPRPRTNQVLYRGVLAAHSARRPNVVPAPDDEQQRPRNATFCELMKHGLGLDVLACPCGHRMLYVATIFDRKGLARLLRAKGLPHHLEPIRPARGPPQRDFDFDA